MTRQSLSYKGTINNNRYTGSWYAAVEALNNWYSS